MLLLKALVLSNIYYAFRIRYLNTASLTNLSYHIPFRLAKALLSFGHSECQMQLLQALAFFDIYFHVHLF